MRLCSRAQEWQLLSPHAAATEAQAAQSPCSATREASAEKPKSSSQLLQLEKSPCSNEDPAQPKIDKQNNVIEVCLLREQKGRLQIERKHLQITYLQRTDSYPEYIKNFPNPLIRKQSDFLNGQKFEQPRHQKKRWQIST